MRHLRVAMGSLYFVVRLEQEAAPKTTAARALIVRCKRLAGNVVEGAQQLAEMGRRVLRQGTQKSCPMRWQSHGVLAGRWRVSGRRYNNQRMT